ncbi:AraC family transcriptional regulator [Mucilaginibacter sp. BJC16-A38]|uniref:helix-turn-helix transcriptional regulator n=1 Tax=Mucilaginibacter phenanthrenivorans TaxID=1234842 RepID=UPI00215898B3|nr:AraC family transcriptional regulator [Mucilaginibacter phenanthrenivorans]MCR8557403.1 AraC family transcriptional regulator [Mucilaginibacter phenanthrenivorans]
MPFEIKNTADDRVLHADDLSAADFKSDKLIENTVQFNLPGAECRLREWIFNGIRMVHQNWHYKERLELAWKGDLDVVTLCFNMRGKTTIENKATGKPFELGKYQHNLFYSQTCEGTLTNDELYMETFTIQFNTDAFQRLTAEANDVLKRFGVNVIAGKNVSLSDDSLYMDINMLNAINAIVSCNYQDELKKMFLHSKSIELLVLQAEAYNNLQARPGNYLKTEYDKERIIYAREYLIQRLDMPPSLVDLARAAGINEYKLKRGFKEMFGNTVFGYLADTRLELAKTDLLEHKKPVSEIAFELGYSSVQHFSSAFKKKFGVSPTKCS